MLKEKIKNKSRTTLQHKVVRDKLIVILGPTATGKTKLAVKLAQIFNGEIVSADSRQVYKGMDIGTGKDLADYGRLSYHLIDVASPKKRFSLSQYQKLAYQAIDNIIKRGKTPFLVGGSGLYIQAIVDDYQLADVKPDKKLREHLNMRTLEELQALAKKYKITLNQSDWNNKRRLIRHIEIRRIRNKELRIKNSNPKYHCLLLGIKYPRDVINQRIDRRLKQRLEKEGLIDEVKKLRRQGLSWKKLDEFGLEYRFIAQYLRDLLTYEQMTAKLSMAIHQFAKRQMTWFSAMDGQGKRIKWIKSFGETKRLVSKFITAK